VKDPRLDTTPKTAKETTSKQVSCQETKGYSGNNCTPPESAPILAEIDIENLLKYSLFVIWFFLVGSRSKQLVS
jgi:hypothetical protein